MPQVQHVPAVDLSATPVGWVPVASGDAQVSVPASFYVSYGAPDLYACQALDSPGALFVVPMHFKPIITEGGGCPQPTRFSFPPTVVSLFLTHRPADVNKKLTTVNGLPVYLGRSRTTLHVYVPSLGVELIAAGLLAHRVAYTLTRSPRSVALAKGPVPSVPSSWRSVTFGGIRLSVPASWPVEKESLFFLTCFSGPAEGYSLSHASVVLDTDVRVGVEGCVAAPSSTQPVRSPSNGLRIDTGPAFLRVQTFRFASGDCLDLHGLTACPATSPDYSILVLRVTVPGRSKPVFVSIGLAGNGVIARTILYSLRAA